jgi:hypothetical protein
MKDDKITLGSPRITLNTVTVTRVARRAPGSLDIKAALTLCLKGAEGDAHFCYLGGVELSPPLPI